MIGLLLGRGLNLLMFDSLLYGRAIVRRQRSRRERRVGAKQLGRGVADALKHLFRLFLEISDALLGSDTVEIFSILRRELKPVLIILLVLLVAVDVLL